MADNTPTTTMVDTFPDRPRRRLIGVSFKMYFSLAQTTNYITTLTTSCHHARPPPPSMIDIFVIPDFLALASAHATLPPRITLGAQNCGPADAGAFTGEVSAKNLADLGVGLVELGHAERRRHFGETDQSVAIKAGLVVKNGMVPLVCVGEEGRGDGEGAVAAAVAHVEKQLVPTLDAIETELAAKTSPSDIENDMIVVAYEPVWAIGAAEPAPVEHVARVAAGIRALLDARNFRARILYGGSAGPGLWDRLKAAETELGVGDVVDGLFLGRFAHNVETFIQTMHEVYRL